MNALSEDQPVAGAHDGAIDQTLVVRQATSSDFDQYMPLVVGLLSRGPYSRITLDKERAHKAVERWLVDEDRFVHVAEAKGQPVGVHIGYVGQQWFSTNLTGHDTLLFVAPGFRGVGIGKALVMSFLSWCSSRGATLVFLSSTTGMTVEAAEAIYRGAGFHRVGPIYVKDIANV